MEDRRTRWHPLIPRPLIAHPSAGEHARDDARFKYITALVPTGPIMAAIDAALDAPVVSDAEAAELRAYQHLYGSEDKRHASVLLFAHKQQLTVRQYAERQESIDPKTFAADVYDEQKEFANRWLMAVVALGRADLLQKLFANDLVPISLPSHYGLDGGVYDSWNVYFAARCRYLTPKYVSELMPLFADRVHTEMLASGAQFPLIRGYNLEYGADRTDVCVRRTITAK